MRRSIAVAWLFGAGSAVPTTGWAAPTQGSASGAASAEAVDADASAEPLLERHAPRRNTWHLGVAGGVFLPSQGMDLRDSGAPFQKFGRAAGDVAVRAGYYPLRFLGLELEGTVMPGGSTRAGEAATFWSLRGQVILQLPWWRIVPFASLGGGGLGVTTDASAVGNDTDGMLALGGGLKFHINRTFGVRLDVRTDLTRKFGGSDLADSEEILLGLVVRLGPKREKAKVEAPRDADGDGFVGDDDRCPDQAGVAPDGCPARDGDGDGIVDASDACPEIKGDPPNGCPPSDRDKDSFVDPEDKCPDEAGVAPDGCPVRDRDADGILDAADGCPDVPENDNGYEDGDGCPDEVPPDVQGFSGVIEGISFDVDQATIQPQSRTKLDEVVAVLVKHPKLRVEITGHTDSTGPREHNMDLSQRRADAVREHLVQNGIDATRLETRGAGPDEPIDSNSTQRGRARNRRIEFRVLN